MGNSILSNGVSAYPVVKYADKEPHPLEANCFNDLKANGLIQQLEGKNKYRLTTKGEELYQSLIGIYRERQ